MEPYLRELFMINLILLFLLLATPVWAQDVVDQAKINIVVDDPNQPQTISLESSKEVLVEARVVQIILNDVNRRGVDWEASVDDYQALSFRADFDDDQRPREGLLSIGTLEEDERDTLIEALDTVGIVDLLASTHVVTKSRGRAKIFVGLNEPFVITMTSHLSEDEGLVENTLLSSQGVQFYVTSSIAFDGGISVSLQPDPTLFHDLTEQSTKINIKDGNTIVIGGLIKEERVERLRKIPLLGDLPILGFAFRNPNQTTQSIEYVILLTFKVTDRE